MLRHCLAIATLAVAGTITSAAAADYVQAAGSTLAFAGTYQGEVFTGRFPGFQATVSFDPTQLSTAKLDVAIPLAGATTSNRDYDTQMLGDSFLAVARFPQARYTATQFRSLGGNKYATDGVLSLHGIDKPVTLVFTWTPGPTPQLVGKATVRRLDFGIGAGDWADTGLIPDAIAVSTKLNLTPR